VTFVDTGFFFALASAKDPDHERAKEAFRGFQGRRLPDLLLTTNHVVSESITLARYKIGHAAAVSMGEQLYSEQLARIHWASPDEQRAAFEYFRRHHDQKYSAVDCLSFVVMDKLQIREALAVDDDFTHRFIARPGPRPK
jgi:predicted nucleic acid-binding protein